MNPLDLFRKDTYEQIATLVVPGLLAFGPFISVIVYYFSGAKVFFSSNPVIFSLIVFLVALTSGLILEGIGSALEKYVLDEKIRKRVNPNCIEEWEAYLCLTLDDPPIAQGYLRKILFGLKFELGLVTAIPISTLGLLWAQFIYEVWSPGSLIAILALIFALWGYLFWETFQSAKRLAELRSSILKTCQKPTK